MEGKHSKEFQSSFGLLLDDLERIKDMLHVFLKSFHAFPSLVWSTKNFLWGRIIMKTIYVKGRHSQ